jgi:hypothetical protein
MNKPLAMVLPLIRTYFLENSYSPVQANHSAKNGDTSRVGVGGNPIKDSVSADFIGAAVFRLIA